MLMEFGIVIDSIGITELNMANMLDVQYMQYLQSMQKKITWHHVPTL